MPFVDSRHLLSTLDFFTLDSIFLLSTLDFLVSTFTLDFYSRLSTITLDSRHLLSTLDPQLLDNSTPTVDVELGNFKKIRFFPVKIEVIQRIVNHPTIHSSRNAFLSRGYPLYRGFIHWIGLIHWISYPPFEQPAPVISFLYVCMVNTIWNTLKTRGARTLFKTSQNCSIVTSSVATPIIFPPYFSGSLNKP